MATSGKRKGNDAVAAMALHMQNVPVEDVHCQSKKAWHSKFQAKIPETQTPAFSISWTRGFESQHTAPLRVVRDVRTGPVPHCGDALVYIQSDTGPFELMVGQQGFVSYTSTPNKDHSRHTLMIRGGKGLPFALHVPFRLQPLDPNSGGKARFSLFTERYPLTQRLALRKKLRNSAFVWDSTHLII